MPRPWLIQQPMPGIGTVAEPVCIARTAWKCSTMSVCKRTGSRTIRRPRRPGSGRVADHQARLSAWPESKRRAQQRPVVVSSDRRPKDGNRFAAVAVQPGLVVERVDMGKPAGQEDHDQLPRRGGMMGRPGCEKPAALLRRLNQPGVTTRNRRAGGRGSRPSGTRGGRFDFASDHGFPSARASISRCKGIRWRSEEPGPGWSRPRVLDVHWQSRWPARHRYRKPGSGRLARSPLPKADDPRRAPSRSEAAGNIGSLAKSLRARAADCSWMNGLFMR